MTDDQDTSSLSVMGRTRELLADRGLTFERFFVAMPACCPSRASLLRGQYVHNHEVWHNGPDATGGFLAFFQKGHESSTVATWLDDAGYRTSLIGKYLNFYGEVGPVHVPPGWDEWHAIFGPPINGQRQPYYGYVVNENGAVRQYGDAPEDYVTDVLAEKGLDFMRRALADSEPFFLLWTPYAPHAPAEPAPRHAGMFAGRGAPRPPSFDEADVSDKPPVMQRPPLSQRQIDGIDRLYPLHLESLQAVDEAIARFVALLDSAGVLSRTYIFFTSDNGFRFGQHRFRAGKGNVFQEEIRVPLIVRGPGVPQGATVGEVASNVDLAPTLAELGGALPASSVDGVSLVPLLRGASSLPRDAVLVERGQQSWAVRDRNHIFVEWPDTVIDGTSVVQRELYDMVATRTSSKTVTRVRTRPSKPPGRHCPISSAAAQARIASRRTSVLSLKFAYKRASVARMSSALVVQTNGWSWLPCLM